MTNNKGKFRLLKQILTTILLVCIGFALIVIFSLTIEEISYRLWIK